MEQISQQSVNMVAGRTSSPLFGAGVSTPKLPTIADFLSGINPISSGMHGSRSRTAFRSSAFLLNLQSEANAPYNQIKKLEQKISEMVSCVSIQDDSLWTTLEASDLYHSFVLPKLLMHL